MRRLLLFANERVKIKMECNSMTTKHGWFTLFSLPPHSVPFHFGAYLSRRTRPIYMENAFNVRRQTHCLQMRQSFKTYGTRVFYIKGFLAERFSISQCKTHMEMQINASLCLCSLALALHACSAAVFAFYLWEQSGKRERGEGIHFWIIIDSSVWYVSPRRAR